MAMAMAMAMLFGITAAFAGEWTALPANDPAAVGNAINLGTSRDNAVDVKAEGDKIFITFYGLHVTESGKVMTDAELQSMVPDRVRLASGILDMARAAGAPGVTHPYIAEGAIKEGETTIVIPNYATDATPDVEHIWGDGRLNGSPYPIVLNPDNPWVVYDTTASGRPNLGSLAIGILECKGKVYPLKYLGLGKIVQGPHPELADTCRKGVSNFSQNTPH